VVIFLLLSLCACNSPSNNQTVAQVTSTLTQPVELPASTIPPTPIPFTPPAMQTAIWAALTKDAKQADATSTSVAQTQSVTKTPKPADATATAFAAYRPLSWQEMQTCGEDLPLGEKVKVTGTVFEVFGEDEITLDYAGTNKSVYIILSEGVFSDVEKDDHLIVYGTVSEINWDDGRGGGSCTPYLFADFYTK
jgi:hypothetical protein